MTPAGGPHLQEAEGGQRDADPDGHGVRGGHEVDHDQHEHHPAEGEQLGVGEGVGWRAVEVGGEGHVGDHGEDVGHGQPQQQHVGRGPHVLAGQDGDVDDVGGHPEDAHGDAGVAVDSGEPHLEGHQASGQAHRVVVWVAGVHVGVHEVEGGGGVFHGAGEAGRVHSAVMIKIMIMIMMRPDI